MIVYSKTEEEHVKHVDVVLGLLRHAGVTLKLPKCRLFRKTVEHLGHEITPGRLAVVDAHTRALRDAAFPVTRTQVRSFVGMANLFRRFAPNFARIAKPLTDLQGSLAPALVPPPTAPQLASFEALKVALTSPPVLALPKPDRKYVLDVDACDYQVGASLLQEQDERGMRPAAYLSRTLEKTERSLGVTEKDCLAVVWATLQLRPYLEGSRFLIRTDHDCLRWLLSIEGTSNSRLARWRLWLSELEFDVAYKPGMTHWLPDAMSRLATTGGSPSVFPDDIPVLALANPGDGRPRAASVRGLDAANYVSGPAVRCVDRDVVLEAHKADDFCRNTLEGLGRGETSAYFEDEVGLLRRRAPLDGAEQIVIPAALRTRVLRLEHEATLAGHPGERRMYAAMRRYYYWVGMGADVVLHVRNCASCAKSACGPRRDAPHCGCSRQRCPSRTLRLICLGRWSGRPRGTSTSSSSRADSPS